VLAAKYAERVLSRVNWGEAMLLYFASTWWKDVCALESAVIPNWFSLALARRVGNGGNTSFWNEVLVMFLSENVFLHQNILIAHWNIPRVLSRIHQIESTKLILEYTKNNLALS
jgi:hypothetical protein